MNDQFDLEAFEADLEKTLEEGHQAFRGKYRVELNDLEGLSRDEINAITPDLTDLEKYDEMITVVKKASHVNLSQAEFKRQIIKLGGIALKIADKVPSIRKILTG